MVVVGFFCNFSATRILFFFVFSFFFTELFAPADFHATRQFHIEYVITKYENSTSRVEYVISRKSCGFPGPIFHRVLEARCVSSLFTSDVIFCDNNDE
jgi:hypothetical protein